MGVSEVLVLLFGTVLVVFGIYVVVRAKEISGPPSHNAEHHLDLVAPLRILGSVLVFTAMGLIALQLFIVFVWQAE